MKGKVLNTVQNTIGQLTSEYNQISAERKAIILQLTEYISKKSNHEEKIRMNFICTHNSRRSHIAQIWAQTAAHYYGIKNVETFSGGTDTTAFNPRAVAAMKQAGFEIRIKKEGTNPLYEVRFASDASPLVVFSKKYDDDLNPKNDFVAVMTCSHADENCPLIVGATSRIALTYNDPKDFDGTALESAKYIERVHEIGREILYAFSKVK